MLNRRCLTKGFTLIELLVVIAVLALLLSIIMPSLAKAKELARRTVCLSHLGQLGLICQTYAQDHNDWFPDYNGWPNRNGVIGGQSHDPRIIFDTVNADARPVWVGYVADYTVEKGTDVFYCPSDKTITREKNWPPSPVDGAYFTGYAYWGNFADEFYYQGPTYWSSRIPPPRKTTTIKTSSAIVPLFGDWILYQGNVVPTPWWASHSRSGMTRGWLSDEPTGINSAYADGSARWCNFKSDEVSAIMQWEYEGNNFRFWGVPRVFLKEGYGVPEDLP